MFRPPQNTDSYIANYTFMNITYQSLLKSLYSFFTECVYIFSELRYIFTYPLHALEDAWGRFGDKVGTFYFIFFICMNFICLLVWSIRNDYALSNFNLNSCWRNIYLRQLLYTVLVTEFIKNDPKFYLCVQSFNLYFPLVEISFYI